MIARSRFAALFAAAATAATIVLWPIACAGPSGAGSSGGGRSADSPIDRAGAAAPLALTSFARIIPNSEIDKFAEVAPGIYRGAQPSAKGIELLKKLGVKSIISFRTAHTDERAAAGAGLVTFEIPFEAGVLGSTPPSEDQIRQFFNIILKPENQPVFYHCATGSDRTGLMTALYRMEVDGWTNERAIEEMDAFGYHNIYKDLKQFARTWKVRGFANSR